MIDFGKLNAGNISNTALPPREIFNALPDKNSKKYQYPRDVQSQVWTKWYTRRDEPNLALKMNTGSGKTVVGLMILKSCLNEGKFPAAYICPDPYLVNQVIEAAGELGLEVTDDPRSHRFASGKAVFVGNIHKLVNGKSVFGVGDEGTKIRISSLILDDAHACIDTVEEQFALTIPQESQLYQFLIELFAEELIKQSESKFLEIRSGESSKYMQIPYWSWQDKFSEVYQAMMKYKNENYLKFNWPLLCESLKTSTCILSNRTIEISQFPLPIHMIPSIVNAERKIFMTATLADDSILVSHFGVSKDNISHPIVPDSAGDVGDRMILLPQVINPEINDIDIKEFAIELAKTKNVVVIVPSHHRGNFWEDVASLILTKDNLHEGISKLKETHVGLCILINRYDGIDLPYDACRVLILDGLPDVRSLRDKVRQSTLLGTDFLSGQTIQRIEQGMGRGVRSNDDHCVVLLYGKELTNALYTQGAKAKFSIASQTQLALSEQVAEQITNKPISELRNVLNYCFNEDKQWLTASKGALASLKYEENGIIRSEIELQRQAFDECLNGNIYGACQSMNDLVNLENNKILRGFYKQILAEYIHLHDKVESERTQWSALQDNSRLLKTDNQVPYLQLPKTTHSQVDQCIAYVSQKITDPHKAVIEVRAILSHLQFQPNSSNKFEDALSKTMKYLGFDSDRPEQTYGKGPDNLVALGSLKFLVIECKNETTVSTISKTYCNQLNGSCEWFETNYDKSCQFTPIMIHNTDLFEYAASPNTNIRIMTPKKLQEFATCVEEFLVSLISTKAYLDPTKVNQSLRYYRLMSDDIVQQFTVKYRKKS